MAWWDRDWLDWSGIDPSGKDLLDWGGINPLIVGNQIDITNIDINPFDAGEFLEVDLVESAEIIADAIAEDPIGTIGTIALTMAGVPPYVIAMVQGANTAARGGSLEDVILSAVTSYAGSQIGGIVDTKLTEPLKQALSSQAGGTLAPLNEALANAIGAGTTGVSRVLIHNPNASIEDLARSFTASALSGATLQSGEVETYLNTTLGKIDDVLGLEGSSFANLTYSVQASISAGIATAVSGGDITSSMLEGLVKGYAGIGQDVTDALIETTGMSDAMATLWTQAMGNSLSAAIKGGAEPTDAFFQTFRDNADKGFKEWVNSPDGLAINDKLDSLFGDKEDTLGAAGALQTAETNLANATNKVNDLSTDATQFNALASTYNANMTQENLDAFTTKVEEFKTKYGVDTIDSAFFTNQLSSASAARNDLIEPYTTAAGNYEDALGTILSKADDWGTDYLPAFSEADKIAAFTIRPQFDEAAYKEVLGLDDDVNAYEHYLNNQAGGDEVIAQYTVQELGATLADLKSESSGFEGYVAGKDPAVLRKPISKLNAAGELEEVPSLYLEVIALDEVFSTSEIAKDMVASLNLGNVKKLNSSIDDIVSLSPQDAEKINQIVDNVEEGKTFAEDLADGFKVMFGDDTFAYNSMLKMYSAIGDTIAGTAESGGYIVDKFVDAYNNDSQEGNNYWLQGLGLTDEDAIEMDPSTYGSDMVGDFVTFTQEQQEILLDQMGPRGKQFLEGSQYGGDVTLPTVVFKDVYGVMVPVGFEGDFSVENFTLGKNPTIYGYGLHAAEGLGDIALNVGLAFFGTKGLALGGAIDVAEAVGMSAIAIEEAVLKELENPEYIAGTEYQDTLNNRAGGDRQKANALLLQDAKAYALYAGVADGIADATMAKIIVKPMSVFGSKAINAGTNATAASAAEVAGEVGQEFLNNMGLTSIDALDVELGDNLAGAAIGAVAEGSTGSGAALLNSLVTDIRKDSADNGTVPPSGGKTSTNSNSATAAALAGALSVISPELHAAGSDPTNVLNAAITKDVMLTSIYSLEGLDKLDTPITNAASLVSVLSTNGISDPETIAEIGNVVYNNDFVTKTEISNEIKLINPAFNPSEELSAQAYEQFGGNKSQAELDTLLENFIDPYYLDTSEIIAAAAEQGVTLTEEEAEDYATNVDEDTNVEDIVDDAIQNAAIVTEDEVQTIIDNAIAGLPETASPQDVEDAIETAISGLENLSSEDVETAIETAVSGLENLSSDDVQTIVDNAVENLATTTDVEDAISDAIDGLPETASPQDVEDAIGDALEGLENLSSEDVETAIETAVSGLENLSSDDVQTIVDNAVENLATTTDVETAIQDAIDGLPEFATPDDVETAITDALGDLENLSLEEVETAIETAVGGLENLSSDDVQAIVDGAVTTIGTQIGEVSEDIAALGTDVDTLQTDLTDLISDVGDVDAALIQLSTDLGTSEEAILGALDTTKEALETQFSEEIAGVAGDVEALSADVDTLETDLTELIQKNDGDVDAALAELSATLGTTETNILAELDTTKDELTESFTTAIGDVETSLGNELDTIAKYVGKPAQDVTQTDIDFVIDLIAQENVSQELITQYDVTGDGVVDINDQTLLETALQGEEDVTLADTSMFTPATGLYQQQQQDTQTTQDLITQLNTQLNTKIDDQTEQQNVNNLMQLLGQAEDIGGRRVTVTTPDPIGNITPYDFKSIFRDSAQASRYVSPFGGNQANAAQQALNPMSGFGSFAQGGQVEDENDMLLKMLGELE